MVMQKEPLYRKVNTRARGVHHNVGGDYSHERKTGKTQRFEGNHASMHGRKRRGLDYTPLFRFLLSKVGSDWDDVFSEAVSRLDRPEPIFWMVALQESKKREYLVFSEGTYFSGLYVTDDGTLQVVNPNLDHTSLMPSCRCCTHTFNGKTFTRKYQ
jgi:hypothetical protein